MKTSFLNRTALAALAVLTIGVRSAAQAPAAPRPPENLYRGELVTYPGPWGFLIGRAHIIFVSDEELELLADPDRPVNLSLGLTPHEETLRQICERAQAAGQRTLILAFDHFFAQYRPGQAGKPRRLTPDTPAFIDRVAAISRFAACYGLGLELSLLSPLEIGPGYTAETGESGLWMHYRKGLRDPRSGAYSVQLWRHRRWANNKGPIEIRDTGVRVFAFRERAVGGTPYRAVDPADIVEISETAQVEVFEGLVRRAGDYEAVRIRVHGAGGVAAGERDRVLVVQCYQTPEMDYFSDTALPYLKGIADRYVDAGVRLNGLYSDEMHIQQDWAYFSHHDHGEFALRYVSPGLARAFAARYGAEYADLARYLIYFVHGQEDTANDLSAKADVMHVFGADAEAIAATALLRARYYRFLQDGVVDLFTAAKHHLESRLGYRLEARAHATWAESPTIDRWDTGREHQPPHQYEYTSNFVWSDTVHQAASACYDYFKWGDFLTGNGNDHAEGGWLDRNYWGLALACSTGILNEVPYSYAAHWGMPAEVGRRRQALVNACGAGAAPHFGMVQGMAHRATDVLMLYPLDLVAADERFGSWMSQYAYATLVTQAKLLERGRVDGGAIELAGRRFTTLVTAFEPFPAPELLDMMRDFAAGGGRVVWSGPPPLLAADGTPALARWAEWAGVECAARAAEGIALPGREIRFAGTLAHLPPMPVLTHFTVDRIYPVTPQPGTEVTAQLGGRVIGTLRALPGGGGVAVLGFRPRDDQAASLGREARWWFEILDALGAHPPTGAFGAQNDNPEHLSRTTPYLVCRFPNGTVALAPHLRELEESWPGGFARKREEDAAITERLNLPPASIALAEFRVAGHAVTYAGEGALAFRAAPDGALLAFAGEASDRITVDGRVTVFADAPLRLAAWAPVQAERRVPSGALLQMMFAGTGTVRVPIPGLSGPLEVVAEGARPGSRGETVASRIEGGALVFELTPALARHWLYAAPAGAAGQEE